MNLTVNAAAQKLSITCLKPFSTEITITAKAQDNTIGQLVIYPNAVRYKTVLQPVMLKFAATEGTKITKQVNEAFLTKLLNAFNKNAFNQAYIYAELAPQTDVITLARSQFLTLKS